MIFRRDWRCILKWAWSMRLIAIAAVLTGLEGTLPYLDLPVPPGLIPAVTFVVLTGAFIARLLAQKKLSEPPCNEIPASKPPQE